MKQPSSRVLLACITAGILVVAGLITHVFLVRPYVEARQLVEERLREGRAVVAAVYEFQRQHGRWPSSIEELAPQFLEALPKPHATKGYWSYSPSAAGMPPALGCNVGPGRRLMYGFPPRTASLLPPGTDHGWVIDSKSGEEFVATD
ncbi:MAG: hypothetical protein B7Z73_18175 [Planctomycetia bacterium 21-64-5]|nr:MAG: hypothetical protein B7Z73_18175 [Planctomycetia bacterium 21-64-5]HQU43673.1 hypothetical protein [Pirellulales bacterium]